MSDKSNQTISGDEVEVIDDALTPPILSRRAFFDAAAVATLAFGGKAQPNTLTQNRHGRRYRTARLASRFASIVLAILLAFAMSFSAFALDSEGVSGGVSNAEHVDGTLARANENADATEQDAAKEVEDSPSAQNDNSAAGKATITFTGKGDYQGTKDFHSNITKRSLSEAKVSAIPDQVYTGGEIKPKPEAALPPVRKGKDDLPLIEDTDYALSYDNNVNVGQATA